VKVSWKKHGKHGSHHRAVFFPSVILAGFLLLMNFKSAHFFHTHGFAFSENSEASKDMIFPTSPPPPAWYWIYWSLTRKCLLAAPSKSGGISIEKTLTNGELTGLFPGSI